MRLFSRLRRAIYIAWMVWRFGLDALLLDMIDHPWARTAVRLIGAGRSLEAPRGARLRMALEHLGPIFIKFGQVLSTRRDLLPPDIANELARLQDRVQPFDSDIAVAIIEQAFDRPLHDIFASFEHEPVASASIAQVHFATIVHRHTQQETEVAVKVLRPNMRRAIDSDLDLMRTMAALLHRFSAEGRRLKPLEVVAEFDKYLHDELDLMREAANAAQLRRNMEGMSLVSIPEVYWDYCHTDVMVMQRMHGISINRLDELRAAGVHLPTLAKAGVEIFFTQVFRDGLFHADMHPGNIRVSLQPQALGQYILLDFGIVGSLTEYDKEYLAQNFAAFFGRDYKRVAELHVESGWVPADTRIEELEAGIRSVCEPYFDRPLKEISLGMVLMRLFQVSRRFHVEIQPQLVLLQKTLLNVEGLGRELDPDMDLWSVAQPFLQRWMQEQVGPKRFISELRNQAPRYARLLPELPGLLHKRLSQPQQQVDAQLLQTLLQEQRKTNRLLQIIIYSAWGFVVGVIVFALLMHFRLLLLI